MSAQRSRAVAGSLLGGVLGGILGVVLGVIVSNASAEAEHQRNVQSGNPLAVFDFCGGIFSVLIGAGIGGILGAIAGSALGAGLVSRHSERPSPESTFPHSEPSAPEGRGRIESAAAAAESPEAELVRLRQRVAELERKNEAEQKGQSG